MRRRWWAGIVGGAGALLIALAWPCVPHPDLDLADDPRVPRDPAALDDWLAQEEAAFTDITPGAEKAVVWADGPRRAPLSLVYLHGYSATRQEISPLCEQVAQELGANIFFTRLRGHGRSGEAMVEGSVEAWVEDGREALAVGRAIGDKVVLVGTSTGATLAAWLAAEGARVDGLVLISPNFEPQAAGVRMLLLPGRRLFVRLAVGRYREWEPTNAEQARYWTWRYPAVALFPMMELVALVEDTPLDGVTAPALVLYSPDDEVIRPELVRPRTSEFNGPVTEVVEVNDSTSPSHHVLAGRILSPDNTSRLAGLVTSFLRERVSAPP